MTDDPTIDPTETYVLDDDCLAELEESRLTAIVKALSEESLESPHEQDDEQ